ncbi:hypothetical protein K7432_018389, partial [Basidiobolus ranarum]
QLLPKDLESVRKDNTNVLVIAHPNSNGVSSVNGPQVAVLQEQYVKVSREIILLVIGLTVVIPKNNRAQLFLKGC